MESVTVNAAVDYTETYAYDAAGNRVKKEHTEGSTTTTMTYVVDTNNHTGYAQVLEEWQGATETRSYVIGNDVIAQAEINVVGSPADDQVYCLPGRRARQHADARGQHGGRRRERRQRGPGPPAKCCGKSGSRGRRQRYLFL